MGPVSSAAFDREASGEDFHVTGVRNDSQARQQNTRGSLSTDVRLCSRWNRETGES